ncbi:hypothetical protein VTJ49DRAFT_821 [Mycothermus thermophilus]|uniref:DUF7702 domain-containing protein n=1 Tax=Humicola insolens TaxID=85995 RepID=A0ABR3VF93_HUMIN
MQRPSCTAPPQSVHSFPSSSATQLTIVDDDPTMVIRRSPREEIAIAQTVLFSISLLYAIYCKFTHRNGWFCIGLFSAIRVTGAGLMLGPLNRRGIRVGVFICESLGMVLLVFLILEFLDRVNKHVRVIHPRWFFFPQLLTWADLALAIAGFATGSRDPDNPLAPTKFTQASYGIFTGLYAIVVYVAWRLHRNLGGSMRPHHPSLSGTSPGTVAATTTTRMPNLSRWWRSLRPRHPSHPASIIRPVTAGSDSAAAEEEDDYVAYENRVLVYVSIVSLVLLALRMTYGLLYQFDTKVDTWSPLDGDWIAYLFMQFFPEVGMVYLGGWAVWMVSPPPRKKMSGWKRTRDGERDVERGYELVGEGSGDGQDRRGNDGVGLREG